MDFEVWPGPMEGVGRGDFVRAAAGLKLTPRWMTPFIRITETIPGANKLFSSVSAYLDSGVPVTIQLMGGNPQLIGECGKLLSSHPAVTGINLNFGCPSSRVLKHGSGGELLSEPESLCSFCQTVANFLPAGKLSVKIRSGRFSHLEMEKIIPQLCKSQVVEKIFFHYRTVAEGYSSAPLPMRSERIARAVEISDGIPVIANGDISSVEEGEKIVADTGAAGVMIARPWLKDPFLLRRFSEVDVPEPVRGREIFFASLQRAGITGGALIELAKLLWGVNSPEFIRVVKNHF